MWAGSDACAPFFTRKVRPMKLSVPLAAAALAFWFGTAGAEERAAPPLSLTLATGSAAGVYFPLGSALAATWSREIEAVAVTAETSFASVVNMQLIESGESDLALVQNDIASYAGKGTEMFAGSAPLSRPVGMAMLYPEMVQIVTLAGSGIETVADLAGKRVAVGAAGSGTERNAHQILQAHGLSYGEIHEYYLTFGEAVVSLRDGVIHAAFLTAGVPTRAVADLDSNYGLDIALVPVDSAAAAETASQSPYFSEAVIPAGTYAGVETDTRTLAVVAMLVASRELDAGLVERMLEVMFSEPGLRRLCAAHPRGCDVSLASALEKMPLPLHPGAERFFARQTARVATH
jgi:uncharacterized protein